ncbi:MAG TPA: Kazal-type serine protease inhibitor domain-containing protein [Acidobacteriota bacterium]|nr:Kazal-type serine protease inhibitor domain-containing protein [Acidobacteriota bacterium]
MKNDVKEVRLMQTHSGYSFRNMIFIVLLFAVMLLLSACSSNKEKLICDDVVQPVCSSNNQTYSSICALWRDNLSLGYYGVCHPDDVSRWNVQDDELLSVIMECGTKIRLLCGVDQHTYINGCYFNKAGVRLNYVGDCRLKSDLIRNTQCENKLDFVCGSDNVTYQNSCLATAYGVSVVSEGRCKNPVPLKCNVTSYVCGKDGVSYENECVMLESGAEFDYSGMCAGKN